jgi:hypothetical protein
LSFAERHVSATYTVQVTCKTLSKPAIILARAACLKIGVPLAGAGPRARACGVLGELIRCTVVPTELECWLVCNSELQQWPRRRGKKRRGGSKSGVLILCAWYLANTMVEWRNPRSLNLPQAVDATGDARCQKEFCLSSAYPLGPLQFCRKQFPSTLVRVVSGFGSQWAWTGKRSRCLS